jgi:hypothetical protein
MMSVKFKDVTARELVRVPSCLVMFCEVQRCYGSLRSSHSPRIGKGPWLSCDVL